MQCKVPCFAAPALPLLPSETLQYHQLSRNRSLRALLGMSEADRKALKIKTGSVKRLAKELVLYGKEQDKESQRVADMKASGADAHDIKHAVRNACWLTCASYS